MQSSPHRVVLSMADALFEIEAPERDARLRFLADEAIAFITAASLFTRIGLRAALVLLSMAPLLLFVSWRRLDGLDRDRRREMLALIERSPLGLALVAWRTILMLHFYEDARELTRIGYRHERKRHLALIPVPASSGVRLKVDVDVDDEEEKGAA